jgi:hypothetical protein
MSGKPDPTGAASFTPGLWQSKAGDSVVWITTADGLPVAVTDTKAYWQRHDETDLANARLIAAAPDLYETLEAMVHWNLKRGPFDEPLGESEQEPEVNLARAALAKARGEQP